MIYHDEIASEIESLKDMVDGFGNSDLTHNQKQMLSDQLAETAYMIRFKYGLTSAYYVSSEIEAQKKARKIEKTGTAERVAAGQSMVQHPDPVEDLYAEWHENINFGYMYNKKRVRCSKCRYIIDDVLITGPEYCPNCRRKMRNGLQ